MVCFIQRPQKKLNVQMYNCDKDDKDHRLYNFTILFVSLALLKENVKCYDCSKHCARSTRIYNLPIKFNSNFSNFYWDRYFMLLNTYELCQEQMSENALIMREKSSNYALIMRVKFVIYAFLCICTISIFHAIYNI